MVARWGIGGRGLARVAVLGLTLLAGVACSPSARPGAASVARWDALLGQAESTAPAVAETPVPLGETAAAGPWQMRVVEILTGAAATDLVVGANAANEPPREGVTYLAVRIAVTNDGPSSLALATGDFVALAADGSVRRFVGAFAPSPAIDAVVEPGAAHEGWAVLAAPDGVDSLLLFDSLSISGNWADRTFALAEGDVTGPAAAPIAANDTGADPAVPAGVSEAVVTGSWAVEVLEVVSGDTVYSLYPASDYRTTALGAAAASDPGDADGDGAVGWLAIRVRVTNLETGEATVHLPATAMVLSDAGGEPIANTIVLTPPSPDASGPYVPGVAREGWVAFELPSSAEVAGVRFLPFLTGDDPRYLAVD